MTPSHIALTRERDEARVFVRESCELFGDSPEVVAELSDRYPPDRARADAGAAVLSIAPGLVLARRLIRYEGFRQVSELPAWADNRSDTLPSGAIA